MYKNSKYLICISVLFLQYSNENQVRNALYLDESKKSENVTKTV